MQRKHRSCRRNHPWPHHLRDDGVLAYRKRPAVVDALVPGCNQRGQEIPGIEQREPDGWNTDALTGDPVGLYVGGVTLPRALADARLIDEYEFVVYPTLVGHRPRLFEGLAKPLDLRLIQTIEFASGIRAERYVPVGKS
jgi:hypothetical protein